MVRVWWAATALLIICVAVVWAGTAAAASEAWVAVKVRGDVRLYADGAAHGVPLQPGDDIAPGSRIETGPSGHATVSLHGSTATLAPDSKTEFPRDGVRPRRTTLLQSLGSLFLKVEKRPTEHFEVKTPYLAAVVKGTTFTVSVSQGASSVQLMEGSVQVTDLKTLAQRVLRPGQTASVAPGRQDGISIRGAGGTTPGEPGDKPSSGGDSTDSGRQGDGPSSATGTNGTGAIMNNGGNGDAARGKSTMLSTTLGERSIDIFPLTDGLVRTAAPRPNAGKGVGKRELPATANGAARSKSGKDTGTAQFHGRATRSSVANSGKGWGRGGKPSGIKVSQALSLQKASAKSVALGLGSVRGNVPSQNGNGWGAGGNPNSNAGGNGNSSSSSSPSTNRGNGWGAGGNPNSNAGGNSNGNNGNGNNGNGNNGNGNAWGAGGKPKNPHN